MAVERLTPKEAAGLIGYSVKTLQRWREQGTGPRWVRYHGRIWYRRDWIKDWENSVWAKVKE
jgi:predicted site-specific integrase-resolvase